VKVRLLALSVFALVISSLSGQIQLRQSPAATAPAGPTALGSKISNADAQAAVEFQNSKRKDVGAPPLTWSADLAIAAQRWADHLATDMNCRLQHSGGKYGENLFGGSRKAYTALDASQSWYDEIKDYTPGVLTDDNWTKTGHYTQLVWSKTQRVGMGQATCKDGSTVLAAEYDPPGNYMGQKPY
jgi:pathogenesis-related protein 1